VVTEDASEPQEKLGDFFIPINGLHVTDTWDVGVVRFLPADTARKVIHRHPALQNPSPFSLIEPVHFAENLSSAVAHVQAVASTEARKHVATALAVLRAFQQARTDFETTMFGTPDEVAGTTLEYLAMGVVSGVGWTREGHPVGWTFDDAERHHFRTSPGWRLVASAVGAESPSDGGRRGLLAIDLLSQAVLHPRPAMRVLLSMIAAEALLLDRSRSSQALRLARRCVYLHCGAHRDDYCGRQRETCPALFCDPDASTDRKKLRLFRERGTRDHRWRCSDWHHVLDWYDLRSEIAHGSQLRDESEEGKVLFWLATRLLPAALEWFAQHPDNPIRALDTAIAALSPSPAWEDRLANEGHP
jgi:hypothetical protein